jgi:hypothetical protein
MASPHTELQISPKKHFLHQLAEAYTGRIVHKSNKCVLLLQISCEDRLSTGGDAQRRHRCGISLGPFRAATASLPESIPHDIPPDKAPPIGHSTALCSLQRATKGEATPLRVTTSVVHIAYSVRKVASAQCVRMYSLHNLN